jgi:hypothetical protein
MILAHHVSRYFAVVAYSVCSSLPKFLILKGYRVWPSASSETDDLDHAVDIDPMEDLDRADDIDPMDELVDTRSMRDW